MPDFSKTIIPKSDQLNADDLVSSPITIRITEVKTGTNDQPCIIRFEGDQGRPYKPNKSMRKLIISQWGSEGNNWVGKYLTLYRDPTVKWAGEEVGGIVISGMSDIEKNFKLGLNVTRGRKKAFPVTKINQQQQKADPAPPSSVQEPVNNTQEAPQQATFEIKLSSGDPLVFNSAQDVMHWLKANINSVGSLDQLNSFTERNKDNFMSYFASDPELAKEYTNIIKNREGQFNEPANI